MPVAELATRVKLSDPKPARCAACFAGADADTRFVNYDALIDRGTFVSPDGAGAVLDSIDDLHLCEACVRAGAEVLDVRPQHAALLLAEARDANRRADHWEEYAKQLEAALGGRPEPFIRDSRA